MEAKVMELSLIVAKDLYGVIGNRGNLPWPKIKADLRRFKALTQGKAVVMGRKTFKSIGNKILPDRLNIVISSDKSLEVSGGFVVKSINEAIKLASDKNIDELFFIGGRKVFEEALLIVDKIYLTVVMNVFRGDVYFPNCDMNKWAPVYNHYVESGKETPYDLIFLVYYKRKD